MSKRAIGLFAVIILTVSACGSGETLAPPDENGSDPLIQVSSEGGFVPVEYNLGRGPTFTVTQGGRFIFPGVTTLEYPGALLPAVIEGQLDSDQMERVADLLEKMGIAEIDDESDNSVNNVADASTEVIRYWDANGTHKYSVYSLGMADGTTSPRTAAFAELFDYLHELSGSVNGETYQPESVRVVAGVYGGGFEPEFEDVRDWPLEGENPLDWDDFSNIGDARWTCKVFPSDVLDTFADAKQTTVWASPSDSEGDVSYQLLVRPLHPGEDGCELS